MVEVVQGVTAEQAAGAHREETGHSQRQGKDIDCKDTEEGPEMFRPNYEDACELGPDDMYPNQDCVEVGPDLPQLDKGYCEKHETYERAEYCESGQGNLAPFTSWCSSCVPHDEHEGEDGAESHKTPESPDVKQKLQERVPEVGMEPPHCPKTVQIGSRRVQVFSDDEMFVKQAKFFPIEKESSSQGNARLSLSPKQDSSKILMKISPKKNFENLRKTLPSKDTCLYVSPKKDSCEPRLDISPKQHLFEAAKDISFKEISGESSPEVLTKEDTSVREQDQSGSTSHNPKTVQVRDWIARNFLGQDKPERQGPGCLKSTETENVKPGGLGAQASNPVTEEETDKPTSAT